MREEGLNQVADHDHLSISPAMVAYASSAPGHSHSNCNIKRTNYTEYNNIDDTFCRISDFYILCEKFPDVVSALAKESQVFC